MVVVVGSGGGGSNVFSVVVRNERTVLTLLEKSEGHSEVMFLHQPSLQSVAPLTATELLY